MFQFMISHMFEVALVGLIFVLGPVLMVGGKPRR